MKRRSVRNDPINTAERDRGAVLRVAMDLDLDQVVPVKQANVVKPSQAEAKK